MIALVVITGAAPDGVAFLMEMYSRYCKLYK